MAGAFGYEPAEPESHGYEPVAAEHGYEPVPQTPLLSVKGVSSLADTVLPTIKKAVQGIELHRLETPDDPTTLRRVVKDESGQLAFETKTPEKIEAQRQAIKGTQAEIEAATPKNQSYPLEIARGATQSIAQNAIPLAASIATKNPIPAVTSAAAATKGQVYADNRVPTGEQYGYEKAPVDIETARLNAGIQAGLEGGLEILPTAGLLKDVGKETLLKTAGKYILREEATEIPTTIGQSISEKTLVRPGQSLESYVPELGKEVLDTALTTPFAAGGTVALAKTQQAIQDKLFARQEAVQQDVLADAKASMANDIQASLNEAVQGIDPATSVAQKMDNPPPGGVHADIPDAPLTAEQESQAAAQLDALKTGANVVPPDPVAVADTAELDTLLTDPVYKQPAEVQAAVEDSIQYDMDRGMSREVAERRAREQYPNALQPTARPIAWSADNSQIGLNLQQTPIQPGQVVLIGGNTEQFSPAYTAALGSTIQSWANTIMPAGSRIVVNLSGLTGEAVGGYQQTSNGIHVITPRELVRTERGERQVDGATTLGTEAGSGYNTFTQQQTFGALTHEFGHALTMAAFAQGMPQQYNNVVSALDSGWQYSEQDLAQMPAEQAAVIRDFQTMKGRVLDGSMSAEELTEKWLGTWKLGKDLMKGHDRSLYSFAKEVLLREAKRTGDSRLSSLPLSQIPAVTLVHAMGRNSNVSESQSNLEAQNYYLQFNEYMAEQFSRYAHANKIDQGTALGAYFKRALESLRALFKMLKTTRGESGDTVIKPGVSFQEWVDGMGRAKAIQMGEKREFKPSGKKAVKRKVKAPAVADLPKQVAEKVEVEEEAAGEGNAHVVIEQLAEEKDLKEQYKEYVRVLFPDPKNDTRAELMRMIAAGQLMEVEDQLNDIADDRIAKSKVFLDKDIPDAEAVKAPLKKLGITKTGPWQKAMAYAVGFKQAVLQIQQLAHTSNDQGMQMFVIAQNKLMAMKNNLLKKGTEVAEKWENLSRSDAAFVDKFLQDEFLSGGHVTTPVRDINTGLWTHEGGPAMLDYMKQRGVDGTTPEGEALAQLILDIKNSFLQHIQAVEDMAIQNVKDRYRQAPLIIQKRSHEIRELARKWRATPFVPQAHHGDYVVKVFETKDGVRQLALLKHFETAGEQDAAVKKLQKTVAPKDLKWFKLASNIGVQLSLPQDFLETLADTGEFTSDQIESIGEAMVPIRDEKGFSKFARDASKVAGASEDILSNYANWIEDSANFISKLTYGRAMTKARAWTRSDMNELKRAGDVEGAREKQVMLDTMTKAQQFILHPMEEWFKTRSVVSLTYLMYAPKTALMNATGLFQSWAAITADYGEFMGNKLMVSSAKDLMSGKLTADEHWMKNKALEDGIIDQGFGYFMSGLANAGNLARRVRPTLAGRAARGFVDLGMYPFKAVETANRNLTMLAMYRAERLRAIGRGETVEDAQRIAYNSAATKTRLLQNDYASGNRPEVLRGKKSLFMIFLSYPQYMLWIMSGGYERGTRLEARNRGETPRSAWGGMTMRMWLIFLLLAGTEGVPFGDTIHELLQRLWKMFGKGENVKVEGQRFLKDTLGIESMYWRNVIQRGFLHDVLGVDLSGSYSLGKPLPGLDLINPRADNWQEFVGEAFQELSGPFGGVVKGGLGLGMAENVGLKELGQNLPGALGSLARAGTAASSGIKTGRGERILRDAEGNLREPTKAEIALLGTGFRLSEVARFQELEALKRQQQDYWNGRRLGLKHQYKKAVEDRDPALRSDVDKAVAEYNAEIPDRGLRLTGKEMREYVRSSSKAVRKLETDRDPQRIRGLNRGISEVMSDRERSTSP